MTRLDGGDVDALAALYDRHGAEAYRVAQSVCHDSGRAEDAVQAAFVSLSRGRETSRGRCSEVGPWVISVVLNRALDLSRHDMVHAEPTDAARVRTALAALPETQREVITLAFYGRLSHTAIAAVLELPSQTVKERMRHGMRKLQADIRDESGDAISTTERNR